MHITGHIVDVVHRRVYTGTLHIGNGRIVSITEHNEPLQGKLPYLLPGFVDAHVHIESSMLTPSEFARLAVVHGTVATVSDPHEIANVLGMEGVQYMIDNGLTVPMKFYFGAPSCVPATPFESSGAEITADDIRTLLQNPNIRYLSEMMNFPGVIHRDSQVMEKINHAREAGKVIDGHIPGIRGSDLQAYVDAGISTDHECFTIEEAREKIALGMKVLIREGSAAKNFSELIPLLNDYPDAIMLCSDDKHPNDLIEGHMNIVVKRALSLGYDLYDVLRSVSLNPKQHFGLDNGLLQPGDAADLIVVDKLADLNILETYIDGVCVASRGEARFEASPGHTPNVFHCQPLSEEDLLVEASQKKIRVIQALDGQLITKSICVDAPEKNGLLASDTRADLLKMVVLNRYRPSRPAIAFIRGFGLKAGAMASTVAHDSHNIIAVGTTDAEISKAINILIDNKGGIVVVNGKEQLVLPLPVAGIMTQADAYETASLYQKIEEKAIQLGSPLKSPFMTLSFMALLVIPELKLSDKGLFDGNTFQFTSLFCS